MSNRRHEKYEPPIARVQALSPAPCAVAHRCDASSLGGAVESGQADVRFMSDPEAGHMPAKARRDDPEQAVA